jgi:hypothetical protein
VFTEPETKMNEQGEVQFYQGSPSSWEGFAATSEPSGLPERPRSPILRTQTQSHSFPQTSQPASLSNFNIISEQQRANYSPIAAPPQQPQPAYYQQQPQTQTGYPPSPPPPQARYSPGVAHQPSYVHPTQPQEYWQTPIFDCFNPEELCTFIFNFFFLFFFYLVKPGL